ncbi:Bifunctional ligase/repressor BirA [subsurface metagenome]
MTAADLTPDSITRGLGTRFIGQKVIYYRRLSSTMEAAREQARQGAAEGTTIIAGEQTGGRGRLGRPWLSPPGNIALSVILYPDLDYLPSLVMLASLAVVHAIKTTTRLKAQISWPNDVIINGKKVCGILVESDVRGGEVAYAVVGMGVNVNLNAADFPDISATATSLRDETGGELPLADMIRQLLLDIEGLYMTLQVGGSVYEEWRDSLATLGRQVTVTSGDTSQEGIAEGVDRDGALRLRLSDGSLVRVIAADVTLHG